MSNTLISLLSDALHERRGNFLKDQDAMNSLLKEASRHGVASAVIEALPKEESIMSQSLEAKLHALDMSQGYEGAKILEEMTNRGIPCIPLKGWVFRNFYPSPHMRTMGDLDLLITPDQLLDAEQVMIELGYLRESENFTGYHVCYYKGPCITVEIHIRLTEELVCPVLDSVWDRAIAQDGSHFLLSDEDSYLFLVYHGAKHAILGGIGIRYIMDLWVLLNRFSHTSAPIHREQISQGLSYLGLTSFASYSEQLASEWFGRPEMLLTDLKIEEATMDLWREYVLTSGAFGGTLSSYNNQLTGSSMPALVITKIFPCRSQMEIRYPVLRQKPWLMPKFWIKRLWAKWADGEAQAGLQALASVSQDDREKRRDLLRNLGLNGC